MNWMFQPTRRARYTGARAPVYPRGMAGNVSEPRPTGERQPGEPPGDARERARPQSEGEAKERYGKLVLRRVAKRDGRALILYEREPGQ